MHASIFQLVLMILYCFLKINNHIRNILFTLLTVEFLAQYIASVSLPWKIDMLTIYWFVWQLSSLVLNWVWLHLLPPILIIEQGSLCVVTTLVAWLVHFIFFRYIPVTLTLFCLWIFSVIDM